MTYWDLYEAEHTMHRNVQDRLDEAQNRARVAELGVGRRAWWSRLGCWLAARLGRSLVALGTRLEPREIDLGEPAQPRPAAEMGCQLG
jgi:hypothetical protein